MKKFLLCLIVVSCVVGKPAVAQTPTPIVPQSQQAQIFNAVSSAQTSGCLQNQGQNIWFSNYVMTGIPAGIDYRLEYSYNSDAATCTTGTWFALSDDATDLSQAEVVGVGAYPYVRANLVTCSGCTAGTITLSAFYSASSANPGFLNGFYNSSQQARKVLAVRNPENRTFSVTGIGAPFGSTAGFLVLQTSGTFAGGCSVNLISHVGTNNTTFLVYAINTAPSGYAVAIPLPSSPATSVDFNYTSCGVGSRFITATYYFFPPNQATIPGDQPGSANPAAATNMNQEATSGSNAAVSVALDMPTSTNVSPFRGHLFEVNAHCSAGTATLTVSDGGTTNSINTGGTQMWSSGAGDVGTTAYTKSWYPGLTSTFGNAVLVTLGTCGVGNVGTLDVQGSVF